MKIKVWNTWSSVSDTTKEEFTILKEMLTINYRVFVKDRKTKKNVSKPRRFSMWSKYGMPTGLIPMVLKNSLAFPHVEIEDCRYFGGFGYFVSDKVFPELWNHQAEAIQLCKRVCRGVIAHATGAGKTTTFAKIIAELGGPALVIVPNLTLLMQTKKVLEGYLGKDIGVVGGKFCDYRCTSYKYDSDKAPIATVATPKKFLNHCCDSHGTPHLNYKILILDEAHHVNVGRFWATTMWYRIAMHCDAYYRFGFTATPGKPDSPQFRLLRACTGGIIHEVSSSELIGLNLLAPVEIRIYEIEHDFNVNEWHQAYNTNILSAKRNQLLVDLIQREEREDRKILVVVDRVEKHGRVLNRLLPGSKFLYGGTDIDLRQEELREFEQGGGILIGTIFGEGYDLPSLDTVVLASGGKSDRLTVQRIGRALRKDKDNPDKVARIIDVFDKDGGMLQKHSNERLRVYRKENAFTVRRFKSG